MIEFAILLHLRRVSEEKVMREILSPERPYPNLENDGNVSDGLLGTKTSTPPVDNNIKKERRTFLSNSNKIDYIALFVFGLLFFIFNSIYWVYYLVVLG